MTRTQKKHVLPEEPTVEERLKAIKRSYEEVTALEEVDIRKVVARVVEDIRTRPATQSEPGIPGAQAELAFAEDTKVLRELALNRVNRPLEWFLDVLGAVLPVIFLVAAGAGAIFVFRRSWFDSVPNNVWNVLAISCVFAALATAIAPVIVRKIGGMRQSGTTGSNAISLYWSVFLTGSSGAAYGGMTIGVAVVALLLSTALESRRSQEEVVATATDGLSPAIIMSIDDFHVGTSCNDRPTNLRSGSANITTVLCSKDFAQYLATVKNVPGEFRFDAYPGKATLTWTDGNQKELMAQYLVGVATHVSGSNLELKDASGTVHSLIAAENVPLPPVGNTIAVSTDASGETVNAVLPISYTAGP